MEEQTCDHVGEYKNMIKTTKSIIYHYENTFKWTKVTNKTLFSNTLLYENTLHDVYKCQYIIKNCNKAEKLLEMITDIHNTRLKWEQPNLKILEQLESYNNIKTSFIRFVVTVPYSWDREFKGVQSWDYDKENDLYTIAFTSAPNPRFINSLSCVHASCTNITQIIPHGDDILIINYMSLDLKGWLSGWMTSAIQEKMRERMIIYEELIKEKHKDIYTSWDCERCGTTWDISCSMCRKCKNKR